MCGTALESLLKYADGVSYSHKGNVDKHVKSNGFHDWAKKHSKRTALLLPLKYVEKNQRTLEDTVSTQSNVANYRRLSVTATNQSINSLTIMGLHIVYVLILKMVCD